MATPTELVLHYGKKARDAEANTVKLERELVAEQDRVDALYVQAGLPPPTR